MGADIHMVLEKKDPDSGRWIGMHDFPFGLCHEATEVRVHAKDRSELPPHEVFMRPRATCRNYDLFAAIAGVRGQGPEPRGLPSNASELTTMVLGDFGDLHSHTWLSVPEAAPIFAQAYGYGTAAGRVFDKLVDEQNLKPPEQYFFGIYPEDGDPLENYRLCIAFDN